MAVVSTIVSKEVHLSNAFPHIHRDLRVGGWDDLYLRLDSPLPLGAVNARLTVDHVSTGAMQIEVVAPYGYRLQTGTQRHRQRITEGQSVQITAQLTYGWPIDVPATGEEILGIHYQLPPGESASFSFDDISFIEAAHQPLVLTLPEVGEVEYVLTEEELVANATNYVLTDAHASPPVSTTIPEPSAVVFGLVCLGLFWLARMAERWWQAFWLPD